MPITKPTQAALNRRIHTLSELKAKADKISIMEKGRDSDLWAVLKEFLVDSVKRHDQDMDMIINQDDIPSDMAYATLKKNYGFKVGANAIISLMENTDEVRAQYTAQIKILEDQIKEAQDSGVLEPQGE